MTQTQLKENARQLLLVANEGELYGIDVPCVQEIRIYQPLTRLPHAPSHVLGVLNVTGQILPVIDLRARLWGRETQATEWHVIVLVKQGNSQCGILVDAANDIADLNDSQIEPMPARANSSCFTGLANLTGKDKNGQSIAILDIEAIARFDLRPADYSTLQTGDHNNA